MARRKTQPPTCNKPTWGDNTCNGKVNRAIYISAPSKPGEGMQLKPARQDGWGKGYPLKACNRCGAVYAVTPAEEEKDE